MGNTGYDVKDVTKVDNSSYGGKGLFATRDLNPGDILYDTNKWNNSRALVTFMNDADIQCPEIWTPYDLHDQLMNYENNNRCNTQYINDYPPRHPRVSRLEARRALDQGY